MDDKTRRSEAAAASARSWGELANDLADLRLWVLARGRYSQAEKVYASARFARTQSIRANARRIQAVHS